MQTMMPITTLMITQIPEHMDADAFRCTTQSARAGGKLLLRTLSLLQTFRCGRRQLDTWGFVGTYNFFYMPPDASPQIVLTPHAHPTSRLCIYGWRQLQDASEGWGGRCVFINFEDPVQTPAVQKRKKRRSIINVLFFRAGAV